MIDQKRKGSQFERDAAKLLEETIANSQWQRIPSSGAMGTIMEEPMLGGDIKGTVKGLPNFRVEAKVGYGGATQMTIKREWLEKIREEAERIYSIPFVIGKFSGSRSDIKEFIVMDMEAFSRLLNLYTELNEEMEQLVERYERHMGNDSSDK